MTKLYAVSVKDSARFEKGTTFGMFVISIIYEIDVEITNMKLGYTYKKMYGHICHLSISITMTYIIGGMSHRDVGI